jgi:phosphoesterase RecJ-like protein
MEMRYLNLQAGEVIRGAKRLLIVAHKKPDGDTLGAACAMIGYCRVNGIVFDAFCLDLPGPQYRFLAGSEAFSNDPAVFTKGHDVLAVFDAGDLRFAGVDAFVRAMSPRPTIVNFDHHATNERFGDINVVDVGSSATTEVVWHFFEDNGFTADRDIATCVLTGIVTDTGVFTNPSTTTGSFRSAAALLRKGADVHDVARRLIRNKPVAALRVWGAAFSRLKYHPELDLASTAIFASDLGDVDDEHTEGIANFLNQFLASNVVLVLRETGDGMVKGSLRTASGVDVADLAKALGGGGHKKASGFLCRASIEERPEGWVAVRSPES